MPVKLALVRTDYGLERKIDNRIYHNVIYEIWQGKKIESGNGSHPTYKTMETSLFVWY